MMVEMCFWIKISLVFEHERFGEHDGDVIHLPVHFSRPSAIPQAGASELSESYTTRILG